VSVLDSAAAIARARAQIGQPDGAGACLANVYKWFGSVQSVGPGAGRYDWAIKAWDYSTKRHWNDYLPPAGVAVLFGPVTAPRWPGDRNYPCGDIGLSIGGGYAIFTDSPNGNTGVMSIAARGSQIGRPYLGWIEDFLGHDTSTGAAFSAVVTTPAPVVVVLPPRILTPKVEADMLYVRSKKTGQYYVIGESTVQAVSAVQARTYSQAVPGETNLFQTLSSNACAGLIDDARKRRKQVNLPVLDAIETALAAEDKPEEN
jgi:hypothetical protein